MPHKWVALPRITRHWCTGWRLGRVVQWLPRTWFAFFAGCCTVLKLHSRDVQQRFPGHMWCANFNIALVLTTPMNRRSATAPEFLPYRWSKTGTILWKNPEVTTSDYAKATRINLLKLLLDKYSVSRDARDPNPYHTTEINMLKLNLILVLFGSNDFLRYIRCL